ncbi:MAG: PepSY domain-containing protein [Caulobacteraceae bacterium]|nr:PepSY domain-containing protein [Caulobacteraceae bacterium]
MGAGWREQQEEARSGVREGAFAPLGQVIRGIGHRSPGRQLDAGIEYWGARPVYRVRWMTNSGRRVDYIVDAATGAILSQY